MILHPGKLTAPKRTRSTQLVRDEHTGTARIAVPGCARCASSRMSRLQKDVGNYGTTQFELQTAKTCIRDCSRGTCSILGVIRASRVSLVLAVTWQSPQHHPVDLPGRPASGLSAGGCYVVAEHGIDPKSEETEIFEELQSVNPGSPSRQGRSECNRIACRLPKEMKGHIPGAPLKANHQGEHP